MICKEIDHRMALDFLLPRHYSGRAPQITKAFGLFEDNELKAVCTFGKPASPFLCRGICGADWSSNVYELNRLCRTEDTNVQLSQFVGWCLRQLKPLNWIVVSFSDTGMHHNGYIYQACNFIFTGRTKERTDIWAGDGKHSRHYTADERDKNEYRVVRTAKNRYVYFCTNSKILKAKWTESLKYKPQPYPKEINRNYRLGEFQQQQLVRKNQSTENVSV